MVEIHRFKVKLFDISGILAIVFGTIVRFRQYLSGRSLWLDEASLGLNIVERSFIGLSRPLDYDQGAPIGFLLIEKICLIWFRGIFDQDLILRLFPLISGMVSLGLMFLVEKQIFHDKKLPVGTLIFAFSMLFVYYSSELKQYSSDAMFSLGLLYLAISWWKSPASSNKRLALLLAGAVGIWFSHPSVFILSGIGIGMVFEAYIHRDMSSLKLSTAMIAFWLLNFVVLYFVSLRGLVNNQFLTDFWDFAFMPVPPWKNVGWFITAYLDLFAMIFTLAWPIVIVAACFFILGVISLILRQKILALILLIPYLTSLLASATDQYPFTGRMLLFITPYRS